MRARMGGTRHRKEDMALKKMRQESPSTYLS
jgi:hypothetical protein